LYTEQSLEVISFTDVQLFYISWGLTRIYSRSYRRYGRYRNKIERLRRLARELDGPRAAREKLEKNL